MQSGAGSQLHQTQYHGQSAEVPTQSPPRPKNAVATETPQRAGPVLPILCFLALTPVLPEPRCRRLAALDPRSIDPESQRLPAPSQPETPYPSLVAAENQPDDIRVEAC